LADRQVALAGANAAEKQTIAKAVTIVLIM
jgi:hypothetical protein